MRVLSILTRTSSTKLQWLRSFSLRSQNPKPHYPDLSLEHSPLLQCLSENRLGDARQLLDEMSRRNGLARVVQCTTFLAALAKSGKVDEARRLFDLSPERNVFTHNAMLSVHVRSGNLAEARRFFEAMPTRNTVSWTLLLCALLDSGRVREAVGVFNSMPDRNVVTWNSMLCGLVKNEDVEGARAVFDRMPERNVVSWNAMISGYVEDRRVFEARVLFDAAEDRNVVTWTTMVSGYCQCGEVSEAYRLFLAMPERNVVSWTAMIGGFARNGFHEEAILLFAKNSNAVKPNGETFLSLAYAIAGVGVGFALLGKQVHAQAIVNGFLGEGRLGIALIQMYSAFGFMRYAHFVFVGGSSESLDENGRSRMITGYVSSGEIEMAEALFHRAPDRDVASCTSMIAGYLSRGEVSKAREIFEAAEPENDAVACTAMISGLVSNELFEEAAGVFSEMRARGVSPVGPTLSALLGAAGATACLDTGKQIHCLAAKSYNRSDPFLGNSLIAMYSKCGAVREAYRAFSEMPARDSISWNSMIMGFSHHGMGREALGIFGAMVQSEEAEPDSVTFLGLLSACSHAGMVGPARSLFKGMGRVFAVRPREEHYICLVDLLGRAGRLEEAYGLVSGLPFEPGLAVWGALLGVCGLAKGGPGVGVGIAELAAQRVLELDPRNGPAYVAMCNVYAASGRRTEEGFLRREMGERGVRKFPGCSWVVVRGVAHVFLSGDYEILRDVDDVLFNLSKPGS